MGWTTCYNATEWKHVGFKAVVDRRKECDRLLTWCRKDDEGNIISSGEVLKSAMVGSTYYAAVRDNKGEVWAAVFLTCGKSRRDGTIWGYKDMDETMAPSYYDCPKSILDMLTPTDNKNANEWREACRKVAAEKKESKGRQMFLPAGVELVENRRGSWILTSEAFRVKTLGQYRGARFAKRLYHDVDNAVKSFLSTYGTNAQKAEFAASGRACPAEWKTIAA